MIIPIFFLIFSTDLTTSKLNVFIVFFTTLNTLKCFNDIQMFYLMSKKIKLIILLDGYMPSPPILAFMICTGT